MKGDTRPRGPVTGELLKDKGDAKHAAVAVKVPDNRQEHPQRGINDADIVFVQLEGYLDADGRSFDIDNLWICDNSVFPSSLVANPALTIMALSLRTAERFLAA